MIQLIPFALVLAIFYFIILLPMKRRQKKVQEFLSALKVGDRIVTSGGIFGVDHESEQRAVGAAADRAERKVDIWPGRPSSATRARTRWSRDTNA